MSSSSVEGKTDGRPLLDQGSSMGSRRLTSRAVVVVGAVVVLVALSGEDAGGM